jgi:hypothetical protein
MTQLSQSKPWQKSAENTSKYSWELSVELGNPMADINGGLWHTAGFWWPVANGAPQN